MSLVGIAAIGFLLVAIFGRQFVGALLVVGVIIVFVTVANLGKPPATPPVAAAIPRRPIPPENVDWKPKPNSVLTCGEEFGLFLSDAPPECYQHRGTSSPPVPADIPMRSLPPENANWKPNNILTCSEMVALVGSDSVPECYQHRGTSVSH